MSLSPSVAAEPRWVPAANFVSDFRGDGDNREKPMSDDLELLRRYRVRGHDAQAAFATLVARHLNVVYSVARRSTFHCIVTAKFNDPS
jgi:hypothetical protein